MEGGFGEQMNQRCICMYMERMSASAVGVYDANIVRVYDITSPKEQQMLLNYVSYFQVVILC